MPDPLEPGQSVTLRCDMCNTQYEVTLEPSGKKAKKRLLKEPEHCPFCGEAIDDKEVDEEEEETEENENDNEEEIE